VREDERHLTAVAEKPRFLYPEGLVAVPEQVEQSVVLSQRDRELDQALDHVRQPGAEPPGCGSKGAVSVYDES
jgi:hypothetical protein